MNQLAVVLIIAHKANPKPSEIASLIQCGRVLHKYRIVLICPQSLDVSAYKRAMPEVEIDFIDPVWQSSYAMFNRLKIDAFLYEKYRHYQYILFYELDAWVFRDELQEWCAKGYDYIGAPWFENWHEASKNSRIIGVGNGGLSLRRMSRYLFVLKRILFLRRLLRTYYRLRLNKVIPLPALLNAFRFQFDNEALSRIYNHETMNEDFFWTRIVPKIFDFKVAPVNEAMLFSFDANPRKLYEMNGNRLPFGCHAWERYEPDFWKQFIQLN